MVKEIRLQKQQMDKMKKKYLVFTFVFILSCLIIYGQVKFSDCMNECLNTIVASEEICSNVVCE